MSFYDGRVEETKVLIAETKAAIRKHVAAGAEDRAEDHRRYLRQLEAALKADRAALRRYNAMINAPDLITWEYKQHRRRR